MTIKAPPAPTAQPPLAAEPVRARATAAVRPLPPGNRQLAHAVRATLRDRQTPAVGRRLPTTALRPARDRFGREFALSHSHGRRSCARATTSYTLRDCLLHPCRRHPRRRSTARRRSQSVALRAPAHAPAPTRFFSEHPDIYTGSRRRLPPYPAQPRNRAILCRKSRTDAPSPPARGPSPPVSSPFQPGICPFAPPIATAIRRRDPL